MFGIRRRVHAARALRAPETPQDYAAAAPAVWEQVTDSVWDQVKVQPAEQQRTADEPS